MAKHVLNSALVTLSSVVLSSRAQSVELVVGQSNANVTAMGDGWEDYVPSGVKHWSAKINFYQDYASSNVYAIVKASLVGTTAVPLVVRPTTGDRSATNPDFSGNVVFDGDVPMMGGSAGEAHMIAVALKGAGTLSFVTTTS